MRQVDLSAAKHFLIVSPDMLCRSGLLIAFILEDILETLTCIWNGWVRLTVGILHIIQT
jgi:hypothetical protein